jgi:hypothetical protein
MAKKCRLCGKAELTSTTENHRYTECGLPNVVLVGVEVRRCVACGHHELVLPRVTELHRVIASGPAQAEWEVHMDRPQVSPSSQGAVRAQVRVGAPLQFNAASGDFILDHDDAADAADVAVGPGEPRR